MAQTTVNEPTVTIDSERLALLAESNHEISKLAEGMVRLLGINRNEDFLMYHGMLARIQQLSELQFFALRLHGESPENEEKEWGDLTQFRRMERVYKGML